MPQTITRPTELNQGENRVECMGCEHIVTKETEADAPYDVNLRRHLVAGECRIFRSKEHQWKRKGGCWCLTISEFMGVSLV